MLCCLYHADEHRVGATGPFPFLLLATSRDAARDGLGAVPQLPADFGVAEACVAEHVRRRRRRRKRNNKKEGRPMIGRELVMMLMRRRMTDDR